MRDGAQEIQRRVRHVRERGYPVSCEQSETRGGEFEGLGYAERDHGVSFTLVGNDDSPLSLAENVGSVVTPAGEGDAVTVIFYELRGKCSPRTGSARLRNSSRMTGSLREVGACTDCVIEAGFPHPTYAPRAEAATAIARAYVK